MYVKILEVIENTFLEHGNVVKMWYHVENMHHVKTWNS